MNITKKYQDIAKNCNVGGNLWEIGTIAKTQSGRLMLDCGIIKAFIKVPHSVNYKCGLASDYTKEREIKDNDYATASELIAKEIYEQFGFMTASYFLKKVDKMYVLASPNFLKGMCQYNTYLEILNQERLKQASSSEEENNSQSQYRSLVFVKNKITDAVKNKEKYLTFMTEECYDKYMSYMLIALLTFSNDEHPGNVIFCKQPTSEKYEDIFIYDKESTVFNFLLAKNMMFKDIKDCLLYRSQRGSHIVLCYETENYHTKKTVLKYLIDEGMLKEQYIEIIKKYANLSFDSIKQDIYMKRDFLIKEAQLDCYKIGEQLAEELAQYS